MSIDEHLVTPEELVASFSRSSNYPKDANGIQCLVDGLVKAGETFNIPLKDIVERCLEISTFCPTDYDLLAVADNLRYERQRAAEAKRNQTAEWEKQYGKPEPFSGWEAEAAKIMPAAAKYKAREAELWKELRKLYPSTWPSWGVLATEARRLGYHDYANAWEK